MTEHAITIERIDDRTKYGKPRRWFTASCACGWATQWPTVQRWRAREDGDRHLLTVAWPDQCPVCDRPARRDTRDDGEHYTHHPGVLGDTPCWVPTAPKGLTR